MSNLLLLGMRRRGGYTGFTVTTTGAQTLTLQGLTVSASTTVDWGDGSSDTYTGSGSRTHNYAEAGTWIVKILQPLNVTLLDLRDAKIVSLTSLAKFASLTSLTLYNLTGLTYNANTNPLPSDITFLTLYNLPGLTYNANANPLPSGITFLYLYNLTGLTYNANTNPLPSDITFLTLQALTGLTWTTGAIPSSCQTLSLISCANAKPTGWAVNTLRNVTYENGLSAAEVDEVLMAVLANKANYTYATPSLDLLGGSNAAPNGTYQAADPVTSGAEAKYALINGNGSYAPGPEWSVTTA